MVNVDTTTTTNITDSADKRFITDSQVANLHTHQNKQLLDNLKKGIIAETNLTVLSTSWVGVSPSTSQITLSIAEYTVTSSDDININIIYSADIATAKLQSEAYSYISTANITSDNTITLTCWDFVPTVDLNFEIEVIRKY
jgi:hypothetical protein